MATKTIGEIGSVVYSMISNIPTDISGTLPTIVGNNVYFAEAITGNTIDTTAIPNEYQPGITSLSVGNVLGLMGAQGIGTKSVKIDELSIAKGMNDSSSNEWKDLGIEQIKRIGEKISFYQSWSSNA